jgi:hypothetical protein
VAREESKFVGVSWLSSLCLGVTRRERCSGRRRKGIVATFVFSEVRGKQEVVGEDEGDDG